MPNRGTSSTICRIEAEVAGRGRFLFGVGDRTLASVERVAVARHPLEPARNPFVARDRLDLRDGRKTAVQDGLGLLAAEITDELGRRLVRHHRQMRGGVSGVRLCAAAALEERDRPSRGGEQVSGGQTR